MRAVVEPLEGNKVKLSIEVDEQEFDKAIDAAFRRLAQEVRVPGFRPGKAPRPILEARLGKEAGRAEALRQAVPLYYSQAVRQHEVDVIADPKIELTSGEQSGPVAFDAVVEVRPRLRVLGYQGLRVVVPSPTVTEEEVDAEVDRLRAKFGELVPVARPARDKDHVTIDLKATRDGEEVAGMSTDDFLYEVGSGVVVPELDEQLRGARPGDILAFSAEVPGGRVQFRVLVKEVKEKVLPELTDEWASEASEFETVEELRADIARQIGIVKRIQANIARSNGALDALVELVDEEPPATLVDAEVARRAQEMASRLQEQGATLAQYLAATGRTEEQLVAELRQQAVPAVKADLALRAVAEAEGLEPGEEEIEAEIERLARSAKISPKEARRRLERTEQMPAVLSELRKRKALDWLVDHAEVVDSEGQPIDRALLEPEPPRAPDAEQEAEPQGEAPEEPGLASNPSESSGEEPGAVSEAEHR